MLVKIRRTIIMKAALERLVGFFINKWYYQQPSKLRQARILVRASLLTSLFSNSYIWLSVYFEYEKGVYLMIFNVIGFLILPLLVRTQINLNIIGNLYVAIGASAVFILTYFSGGIWSGVYPWIISVPILAMLVVNRLSSIIWATISLFVMLWFGMFAVQGIELPKEYNQDMHVIWYISVLTGLLMIIFVVTLIFEMSRTSAVQKLEQRNRSLLVQKEKIAEQTDVLKSYLEEREYMMQILAHDLRNPVSNITSISSLLLMDKPSKSTESNIELILDSTEKAENIINKVLSMDIQGKTLNVSLEEVELANFVNGVIRSHNLAAEKKNIDIQFSREAGNTTILADKTYLTQIFDNLISNSMKFSPSDSLIEAYVSGDEENIIAQITDFGPGISEDDQKKLFGKFSRLSAKPTAGEDSTGLGLSIVKRFTELMSGKVWCESTIGEGTTFFVQFPRMNF